MFSKLQVKTQKTSYNYGQLVKLLQQSSSKAESVAAKLLNHVGASQRYKFMRESNHMTKMGII